MCRYLAFICLFSLSLTGLPRGVHAQLPGTCYSYECGNQSADGCWCDSKCSEFGDCCMNACEKCPDHAVPHCDGRSCGADGCGGTCGSCSGGEVCQEAEGQCVLPGDRCTEPLLIATVPFFANGDTSPASADYSYGAASCPGESSGWGGASNDLVYRLIAPDDGTYAVSLLATFDSTLYAITDCASPSSSCLGADDEVGTDQLEALELELGAGQEVFLVVDGYSNINNKSGTFTLSVDRVASCVDGIHNGDESDVDCGGSCDGCAIGQNCGVSGDCEAAACVGGQCTATCHDGFQNGDESDVDCGSTECRCADHRSCIEDANCQSRICGSGGTCEPGGCDDGVWNYEEVGPDCGGECGPCPAGFPCASDAECQSGRCDLNNTPPLCLPPSCNDEIQNGTETDIDCGGPQPQCPRCPPTAGCDFDADCALGLCTSGFCDTCIDGEQNHDESDVDCGGTLCSQCVAGHSCNGDADCSSAVCLDGTCRAPSCFDGRMNGDESDIDCGGSSCTPCAPGQLCTSDGDCQLGACVAGLCPCQAELCNGIDDDCDGESDEDFGVDLSCATGLGVCLAHGTLVCDSPNSSVCNAVAGTPGIEDCADGLDNDCDGSTDEGREELCNGVDDDCDGEVDNVPGGPGSCNSACFDGLHNGAETGVDCGGPYCLPCAVAAPAPELVAPPEVDPESDFLERYAFFFENDPPLQHVEEVAVLDPERLTLVHGRALERDPNDPDVLIPLAGAIVHVFDAPELGHVSSRDDGQFDILVHGGTSVVITVETPEHFPVDRRVKLDWQAQEFLGDLVLTSVASAPANPISLPAAGAQNMQVARGLLESDERGQRQAIALFPPGRMATAELEDGSELALETLTIRVAEFTVGSAGPAAMPGSLPPTSAYTYALELSVDEARQAGARTVRFTDLGGQPAPVHLYVDDFIGFPVGGIVPVGYYDRALAQWVASENGRVVEVVGVDPGDGSTPPEVVLNVDGAVDGAGLLTPSDAAELAALGVTTDELRALAAEGHQPGDRLWRAPIEHFTPYDCNWPPIPPAAAAPPDAIDEPLMCEAPQVTRLIEIDGSTRPLLYESERMPGGTARSMHIEIPPAPPELQSIMNRVELKTTLARQENTLIFEPDEPVTHEVVWDGGDGYGRSIGRPVELKIELGYVYPVWFAEPQIIGTAFGRSGTGPLPNVPPVGEVMMTRELRVPIGPATAAQQGLGGLSHSDYRTPVPARRRVVGGAGPAEPIDSRGMLRLLARDRITHDDPLAICGVDAPENPAYGRNWTSDVVVDASGRAVVACWKQPTMEIFEPDGTRVTRLRGHEIDDPPAGMPASRVYFGGEGESVQDATFMAQRLAVGPDGSIYFIQRGSNSACSNVIARITPDGRVERIAGQVSDLSEDCPYHPGNVGWKEYPYAIEESVLAREAHVSNVKALAVTPDGNLYFSEGTGVDSNPYRVRRVGLDGLLTTVAGDGVALTTGSIDHWDALQVDLYEVVDLAAGEDGIYIAESEVRSIANGDIHAASVSRLEWDGSIVGVLGTRHRRLSWPPPPPFSEEDGTLATDAILVEIKRIAFDPDGRLHFIDSSRHLRFIDSGGRLGSSHPYNGDLVSEGPHDPVPVSQARRDAVSAVSFRPDGGIFLISDPPGFPTFSPHLLYAEPGALGGQVFSSGGGLANLFSDTRHLESRDPHTGELVRRFEHDSRGRVSAIIDESEGTTTISRPSPVQVVLRSPAGTDTTLELNAEGYVERVIRPDGREIQMIYDEAGRSPLGPGQGLLTHYIDEFGLSTRYSYDSDGRLTEVHGPGGTQVSLSNDAETGTRSASLLGGPAATVEVPDASVERAIAKDAQGTCTEIEWLEDDQFSLEFPDGATLESTVSADPRLGEGAAYPAEISMSVPGLGTHTVSETRSATFVARDPLRPEETIREVSVNGGVPWRQRFARDDLDPEISGRFSLSSPLERVRERTLDAHGRLVRTQVGTLRALKLDYDGAGNLVSLSLGDGADERIIGSFSYDEAGRLSQAQNALGQIRRFEYPEASGAAHPNALSLEDGSDALVTDYERMDDRNATPPRLERVISTPNGSQHRFVVDESGPGGGFVTQYFPPAAPGANAPTTTRWSTDGKLLSMHRAGFSELSLGYDASGRNTAITFAEGQIDLSYEGRKLVSAELNSDYGSRSTFSHTGGIPNLETLEIPAAVLGAGEDFHATSSVVHDPELQVVARCIGGDCTGYDFDADGLLTSAGVLQIERDDNWNYGTGRITGTTVGRISTRRRYDADGFLSSLEALRDGQLIWDRALTRDLLGRIVGVDESVTRPDESVEQRSATFEYDFAGRLAHETLSVDGVLQIDRRYQYDAAGNRNAVIDELTSQTHLSTFDAQDRILTSEDGSRSYAHNAVGDRVLGGEVGGPSLSLAYDGTGKLIGATLPSGQAVDFVLDAHGRRVAKRLDGVPQWVLVYEEGIRPGARFDGNGNLIERYVYGTSQSTPDVVHRGAATLRVLTDERGSPILMVDTQSGEIVQRMSYEAFGQESLEGDPNNRIPFGFAGGLYEAELGLVRFGARDYDPAEGRWTQKDPAGFHGGSTNLYTYVDNDPVNSVDPSGLQESSASSGSGSWLSDFGLETLIGTTVAHLTGATNTGEVIYWSNKNVPRAVQPLLTNAKVLARYVASIRDGAVAAGQWPKGASAFPRLRSFVESIIHGAKGRVGCRVAGFSGTVLGEFVGTAAGALLRKALFAAGIVGLLHLEYEVLSAVASAVDAHQIREVYGEPGVAGPVRAELNYYTTPKRTRSSTWNYDDQTMLILLP